MEFFLSFIVSVNGILRLTPISSTMIFYGVKFRRIDLQSYVDHFIQAFTYSKLTIETLEQGVKYVQS